MAHGVDFSTLSDEDLVVLINEGQTEHSQRMQMKQMPAQIASMTIQYESAGGDRADIEAAIEEAEAKKTEADAEPTE